jgi:UDP-N-acetylglucosamine--N-acetylmuramyl-(pentapeptide) pyrophosphoryl-undecaprenol N-acetylglucosamine transferase
VGNPIRANLAGFSRPDLRHAAMNRYGLSPGPVVVGVFGGSLGAGAINQVVASLAERWTGSPIQILHLAGREHEDDMRVISERSAVPWTVLGFEEEMQYFYAACDLVISRSGGAVAELAVTGTPAVLVPGSFAGGHQRVNAARFESAGAATVVAEDDLDQLAQVVRPLIEDPQLRRRMAEQCRTLAYPEAARTIAAGLQETHG